MCRSGFDVRLVGDPDHPPIRTVGASACIDAIQNSAKKADPKAAKDALSRVAEVRAGARAPAQPSGDTLPLEQLANVLATTDTPFPQHAKSYLETEPQLPAPKIAPERVAAAILEAARKHTRDIKVGVMSKVNSAVARHAPSVGDKMATSYEQKQRSDEAPRDPQGILDKPSGEARVRGNGPGSKAAKNLDGPPSHR